MNPDDFEKQLQRQPLRAVPEKWRAEILQTAASPVTDDVKSRTYETHAAAQPKHLPDSAAADGAWWHQWLWPSPRAWAGLAAAWLAIAVLNVTNAPASAEMAKESQKPSLETEAVLAAQRRELARLLDNSTEAAPAPKSGPPGPRSENVSPPRA